MADQSPTPSSTSSDGTYYLTYNLAFKHSPYKGEKVSGENGDDGEDSDGSGWIPTAGYGESEESPLILPKPGKYMIRLEFGSVSSIESDASWHVTGQVEGRNYSGYFTGQYHSKPCLQDTYIECNEIGFCSRKVQNFTESSKHIILGEFTLSSLGNHRFWVVLDVGISLEPEDPNLVTEYQRESQRKLDFYVKMEEDILKGVPPPR